jgi:hypothetical protein
MDEIRHKMWAKHDVTPRCFGKTKWAFAQRGKQVEKQIGGENREFGFGQVKFALPTKRLCGDVKQII